MAGICQGRSTSCFVQGLVLQVICVENISQGTWDRFWYENDRTYSSYNFGYRFIFIPFLSLHRNKKQESNFQQDGGLLTRNSFAFCLKCVALYFNEIPNSIDFYKKIFLHVIPARIIVPGINQCKLLFNLSETHSVQYVIMWVVS